MSGSTNPTLHLKSSNARQKTDKKDVHYGSAIHVDESVFIQNDNERFNNGPENVKRSSCFCRGNALFTTPLVLINGCEEPREQRFTAIETSDFCVQVTADDIQSYKSVQTSSYLLENDKENGFELKTLVQSKRCPGGLRVLTASKCSQCRDCEEIPAIPSGHPRDQATQTEHWCVTWPEVVQTGPSLTAVGPFSRFDYKLRRTKSDKCGHIGECCRPTEPRDLTTHGRQRDFTSHFQQQVCSLEICQTELVQTVDAGDIESPYDIIIYGSCDRKFLGDNKERTDVILDLTNSLQGEEGTNKSFGCFATQVSSEEISPTKYIQTDPCFFTNVCRKPRKYWKDFFCIKTTRVESSIGVKSVAEATQQVDASDLGDTNETQTCWSLLTAKPFNAADPENRFRSRHRKHGRLLSSSTGNYQIDKLQRCCPATGEVIPTDASSQVCSEDLGITIATQTCDNTSALVKCYIRKHQWACKSWC